MVFRYRVFGFRDRLRSSSSVSSKKGNGTRAWRGAMTFIVLTAIGFLACAFYVYVLFHWMRDTKSKRTTRSAAEEQADEKCDPKRPHIVGFRRAAGSNGRFAAWSRDNEPKAMSVNGLRTKRSRVH